MILLRGLFVFIFFDLVMMMLLGVCVLSGLVRKNINNFKLKNFRVIFMVDFLI